MIEMAAPTAALGNLQSSIQGSIGPVITEMLRLLPDSVIVASGLYAILTISYPFGIFFGSMVEAGILYRFFRYVTSYLGFSGPSTKASTYSPKCRSGFTERPDFTSLTSLGGDATKYAFPSYPLYILTVAATYMFMSLNKLSKELEALGPAYSSRYYSSMIFLGLAILVIFSFRLLYECDNFGVLAMTLVLAFFVGLFLVEQNTAVFGTPSMNLIGIPLLRNRTANGQAMYICPTRPKTK